MYTPSFIFASETASEGTVLQTLGIDGKLLIFQIIGFLLLFWLLRKFVFPTLIRAVDERQKAIEVGLKEAAEAKKALEESETRVEELLAQARKQADEILAATQKEANDIIGDAENKATRRAETIVTEARADFQNELQTVRRELKNETRKLVAAATEQILGEKLDAKKDASLVEAVISDIEERK